MGATYAGILGPLAFVLVLARGLIQGSAADGVLWTATVCLMSFATLGYIFGRIADQVLWDAMKRQFEDQMQMRENTAPERHRKR
ncbi:MAG: hypothetical protein AB7F89_13335 [Pirellulaceae bacterium]